MMNYRREVNSLKETVATLEGKRQTYLSLLKKDRTDLVNEKAFLERITQALVVAQTVAKQTQSRLEYHISNLVTMALAAIWEEPYEFKLRFVERRGTTECDLIFIKNGHETDDIINAGGGGVADVAGFALKMGVWSINPSRNVQILDEPFKYVSLDLQPQCSKMVKMVSKEMKMQIIMVSHLPEMIGSADKVFLVEIKDGISHVTEQA